MRVLRRIDHVLSVAERGLVVLLFTALVAAIGINVLSRNLFHRSFQWLLEKQFPKESPLRLYASDNDESVSDPVSTSPESVEVTGWWQSSDGLNFYIRQNQSRLTLEGTDPYSGTPILEGEGAINGSLLKLRYYRISGVFGTARAKVAANGRKIVGIEISALTGQESQLLLTR